MNYGTVLNGVITAPLAMESTFAGVGAWHTLTDAERAEHGWYPAEIVNEGYEPRTQSRFGPTLSFDGELITVTYTVTDKPLETIQNEDLDRLADIRYAREVAGVTSADGIQQSTSRIDRLLLADKIQFIANNPSVKTTSWKAMNGRYPLSLQGLEELQSLVGFHVDQAYKAEEVVAVMIQAAETVDDLLSINIADEFEIAFSGS